MRIYGAVVVIIFSNVFPSDAVRQSVEYESVQSAGVSGRPEEVQKSGQFHQEAVQPNKKAWNIDNHEEFQVDGTLSSISYELDRALPWYDGDSVERGQTCKFALARQGGSEVTELGPCTSGELIANRLGHAVTVKKGDRLRWWDCDIKPSDGSEKEYQDTVNEFVASGSRNVLDLNRGDMFTFSITGHIENIDFSPDVWTKWDRPNLTAMHGLVVNQWFETRWSGAGEMSITQESYDRERSTWRHEWGASGPADQLNPYKHWKLDQGRLYRFTFRNVEEKAEESTIDPVTYVYLQTITVGCPTGHKCCTAGTGLSPTYQCVKKAGLFGRTCGSKPGFKGARDKHGKHTDIPCNYCDLDFPMPSDAASVYKNRAHDPIRCDESVTFKR